MRSEITFIGSIVRVVGSKVFVELNEDLPSSTPIIKGKIYKVGQVGSFVRIPLGTINVFAIVTMVGANPYKDIVEENEIPFPYGNRWLEIQLIGETIGTNEFQRGISTYPTIEDEIHIVTEEDLGIIYASSNPSNIQIGNLASSESLPSFIDIDKFLTRHSAILGSTGSGKSNTVTAILKSLSSGLFPKSKIILIDPHSEYHSALVDNAKIFSIDDTINPLKIPFWSLSYNELASILFDKKQAADSMQDTALKEKIFELLSINDPFQRVKTIKNLIKVGLDLKQTLKSIYRSSGIRNRTEHKEESRESNAAAEDVRSLGRRVVKYYQCTWIATPYPRW
jgi:hypothetical protein